MDLDCKATIKEEIKHEEPVEYFLISTVSDGDLNVNLFDNGEIITGDSLVRVKQEVEDVKVSVDVHDDVVDVEFVDPIKSETNEFDPVADDEYNNDNDYDYECDTEIKKASHPKQKQKKPKKVSPKSQISIINDVDDNNTSNVCDLCNVTFQFKYQLLVHLNDHQNGNPVHRKPKEKPMAGSGYNCDVCGKSFSRKESFVNHKHLHTGNSPHKCNVCGKTFTRKHILLQHEKSHSAAITDERKIAKVDFPCVYCPKIFTRKEYLKAHISVHTQESEHKCLECNKFFVRKEYLVKHSRLHTGETPFECELCSEKFMTQNALKSHVDRRCSPLVCEVCSMSFTAQSFLTNHMNRSHSTNGNFECIACGKKFVVEQNLLFHMKSH